MFDYSDLTPQRRRRRRNGGGGLSTAVIIAALCLLAIVLIVVRPWKAGTASTSVPPGAPPSSQPVTSAGALAEGACIDPTTSTVSSFSADIRGDLASAVAGLAPPGPLPTRAQGTGPLSQPQPGVNLRVRQVDTQSASTIRTEYSATVTVPGVLGLAQQQPAPGASNYVPKMGAWSQSYQDVRQSRTNAATAASGASRTIASMPLDDNPAVFSAVSACISGLLGTVPATGRQSYLIASDLEENEAPQLAGSFHGAPLLVIQACDSGNLSECQQRLNTFKREMRQLGVGHVTMVRPEVASQAIAQWVRGEDVTA